MNEHVGPLRTADGLAHAIAHLDALREVCAELPAPRGLDAEWLDRHDLASLRIVAECVTRAAAARKESRGAHQRHDFPQTAGGWQRHQRLRLAGGELRLAS
jgi:succinate dehydrogenase/fumarate reductase flavoprotein subunit